MVREPSPHSVAHAPAQHVYMSHSDAGEVAFIPVMGKSNDSMQPEPLDEIIPRLTSSDLA